jgi:hypothetical protein
MVSADYSSASHAPRAGSTPDAGAVLHSNLLRLAARRNALVVWRSTAHALSWGLAISALLVLAYRFYIVDGPAWVPAIPIALSLLIGWRLGVLQKRDAFGAALETDEKLDLKETLSSAYAFSAPNFTLPHFVEPTHLSKPNAKGFRALLRNAPHGWNFFKAPMLWAGSTPAATATELVPSLVEEAASQSQSLQPKKIYPLAFDRTHRVLALCAAIFALTLFMPNVPWLLADEEQAARKAIALQGKELVEVAKEVKKEEEKKPDTKAAREAKKLEALGQKMLRGRMGKKEALTSLGELKKDLEKAAKTNSQNSDAASNQQMQAALEQMAEQPMDSEAGKQIQDKLKKGDAEAAAKEMEKLADKIEKGDMSAEEQKKAADDMNRMAKELKKQGGAKNEEMAQQLEQAAKALQEQAKQQSGNQQQQGDQGKTGQQGAQGGKAQQQQNGGNQGTSNALREMAKSMRQGGAANSKNLQKMLDKIREAEAQSGTAGDKQFNGKMTKPGNGDCKGGDCDGQGVTPGKDLKSNDPHGPVKGGAGLGPRNNAKGSASGGGVSDKKSKRTGDKRRWEDVWSDRVPATRKKIDRVQGKYGEEGETEQLPTKTEAKGGPVKTPYYEVYESYNKDAEDAVSKEKIPPAYKQPVKDYFESIKP